jgi:hypothetical protein
MPLKRLMLTTFFCSCNKDNFKEKPVKTLLTIFNRKDVIVNIINLAWKKWQKSENKMDKNKMLFT